MCVCYGLLQWFSTGFASTRCLVHSVHSQTKIPSLSLFTNEMSCLFMNKMSCFLNEMPRVHFGENSEYMKVSEYDMFKSTEFSLNYFEFPLMNPKRFSCWHVDVYIMIQIIPAVMSAADKTTDDGNWGCFRWQQHDDCCTLSFCCQNLCAFTDTFVCVGV